MNPKAARYLAPMLRDENLRKVASEALYKMELTHRGKAIEAIIGKYNGKERIDPQLTFHIYHTIKNLYQMENSPVKEYLNSSVINKRGEETEFLKGLEKVIFS